MSALNHMREGDLADHHNSHTLAVLSIPPGSRVLDVGSGSEQVARALSDRGSQVWAIELDSGAAPRAAGSCERVIAGDIESEDLILPEGPFDCMLFLDVLEHLRDPVAVLRRCTALLAPGGRVLASISNVAHGAVRLQLMAGRLPAGENERPGRTPPRRFDLEGMRRLFAEAGCSIVEELPIRRELESAELRAAENLPPAVRAAIEADPAADIHQFFFVAHPTQAGVRVVEDAPSAVERGLLTEVLWQRVHDLEQQVSERAAQLASLGEQLDAQSARAAQLDEAAQAALARAGEVEQALLERNDALLERDLQLRHLRLDLGLKERYVAHLQARFQSLSADRDWQIELVAQVEAALADQEDPVLLRQQITQLEAERVELAARTGYARHRAVDALSAAAKRLPFAHGSARRLLERLLARRR